MANGYLTDDQLFGVTGGVGEGDEYDISSDFSTCEDWMCESCRMTCKDKYHICTNGSGVSRKVCRYCFNYDKKNKVCLLGKTVL